MSFARFLRSYTAQPPTEQAEQATTVLKQLALISSTWMTQQAGAARIMADTCDAIAEATSGLAMALDDQQSDRGYRRSNL